jgi:hypothetical protein
MECQKHSQAIIVRETEIHSMSSMTSMFSQGVANSKDSLWRKNITSFLPLNLRPWFCSCVVHCEVFHPCLSWYLCMPLPSVCLTLYSPWILESRQSQTQAAKIIFCHANFKNELSLAPVAHAYNLRIVVRSQPRQTVHETLSQKNPFQKGLVEWLKV